MEKSDEWKSIFDSNDAHKEPLPEEYETKLDLF